MTNTDQNLDEPRLIAEEGLAAKVAVLAAPVARSMGFRLVRVRLSGPVLQVMGERADGSFSIDDCERLSRALSPVLDAEDLISNSYRLEVSSPGVDRPLTRASDFVRALGQEIKLEFHQMIGNRKRARGTLANADAGGIELKVQNEPENLKVPFTAIAEARLVLSDSLLRLAQKHAKPGLSDGAPYDPSQLEDMTMSEDRRTSHGRR